MMGHVQVVGTLYACSTVVTSKHGYEGMCIGTKMADENVREFDDETLAAGKSVLGGQMGYTGGDSQSGMSMGKTRKVCD